MAVSGKAAGRVGLTADCSTTTSTHTKGVAWPGILITTLEELAALAAISFWLSVIIINTCGTLLACCLLWHPTTCLAAAVFLLVQVSFVYIAEYVHCA